MLQKIKPVPGLTVYQYINILRTVLQYTMTILAQARGGNTFFFFLKSFSSSERSSERTRRHAQGLRGDLQGTFELMRGQHYSILGFQVLTELLCLIEGGP